MEIARAWAEALAPMIVRHPDPGARPDIRVREDPTRLEVAVDDSRDTIDPTHVRRLMISTVRLTYFPGVRLARQWLAAAWAGYIQHEALELVTVGDLVTRPIDPHEPPFTFDRGLRCGLPAELTPETLFESLCAVMPRDAAEVLVRHAG